MNGLFVTIEGVEGAGKSTQIQLLAAFLRARGHEVTCTREPGGTPVAERIRDVLLDPNEEPMTPMAELLLYEASRAQHVNGVILPALAAGHVVLCDRFVDSTTAYQGAGRKIDGGVVDKLNRLAAGDAWPHSTILLDLSAEVGLRRAHLRGSSDRFMSESLAFYQRIRTEFLELARREPDRITIIDAERPVKVIQAAFQEHILSKL